MEDWRAATITQPKFYNPALLITTCLESCGPTGKEMGRLVCLASRNEEARCRAMPCTFVFFPVNFRQKYILRKWAALMLAAFCIIIFSFYFKYFIVFLRPKDFSDCRTQWYDSLWFTNHYRITWVEGYLISYKYNMLFCKGWVFWVFNW